MSEKVNGEVKERVLEVATALFSKKGYDGTKMSEIAQAAGVNKALIYYYFPSKQAIMDCLIDSFFKDITGMSMTFIRQNITKLIKEGRLDILNDRFRFQDDGAMREFMEGTFAYYDNILNTVLHRKDMLRIVLAESLRNSIQQDALYRFFLLMENSERNPMYLEMYEADRDVYFSDNAVFRKFFFSLLPLLNFVVFYDSYKALSGLDDAAMRRAYLSSLDSVWASHIVGQDIIIDVIPAIFGSDF